MSFTIKKINGVEYDYFEYYREGKKKTVNLGRSDQTHDTNVREEVLKVLHTRLLAFAYKLWRYYDKSATAFFCGHEFHDEKDGLKAWLIKRQEQYGLEQTKKSNIKELVDTLVKKREKLPLVTVVHKDLNGTPQVDDICVMCLYRNLENYGSFGYERTPKRLGIFFLNDDVRINLKTYS